jgi:predicted phosphodiesterase
MRIAALSDFHIGVTAARDGFRHDLRAFGRALDRIEAQHDRIVLLGDIYQTDHAAVPTRASARRDLAAARKRIGGLAQRLANPPYVHVHGNHDAIAADELGAPEWLREPGVHAAFFIHGHQFDPVARRAKPLADLGTWVTGRLRAIGLRRWAYALEARDVAIKHARFHHDSGPYMSAGRALAREHEAAVVVMGHTHVGTVSRVDVDGRAAIVANTGTCSNARLEWLSIDTEDGRLERWYGERCVEQAFVG